MDGTRVYIGLGSNWGEPPAIVLRATEAVMRLGHSGRRSSLYRSSPQGGPAQLPYCNAVVAFTSAWTPDQILSILQRIEWRFGRQRREHWGPRRLDLDILLFGDRVIDTRRLIVPHPRLLTRRFVLEPLWELAPSQWVPKAGPVASLLALTQHQEVWLWDTSSSRRACSTSNLN